MAADLHAYVRIARLLRIAGAVAVLAALAGVVMALGGESAGAASALQLAVPLGGAALLMAVALFLRSRRFRQDQDPS